MVATDPKDMDKDLQSSGIPHNAVCFFMDGNKWCAVFGDFVNLQESPAGFGDSFETALADLKENHHGNAD